MKLVIPFTLGLALAAVVVPGWAVQEDPHKGHHPAASASAANTEPVSDKAAPDRARMAKHTKAMEAMHGKMMAAKTPEERSALMAEHMKSMQEGMDMMKGMGGMGGMGGSKGAATNMTERQTMMEQRMDMMQTMMEMMVDRLPQTATKP